MTLSGFTPQIYRERYGPKRLIGWFKKQARRSNHIGRMTKFIRQKKHGKLPLAYKENGSNCCLFWCMNLCAIILRSTCLLHLCYVRSLQTWCRQRLICCCGRANDVVSWMNNIPVLFCMPILTSSMSRLIAGCSTFPHFLATVNTTAKKYNVTHNTAKQN